MLLQWPIAENKTFLVLCHLTDPLLSPPSLLNACVTWLYLNPVSLSKINVCMGVQSWLGTISALRALPCPCSRDGCRSHWAHYSFIYLFIFIWMSRFFWSKRWLQAHSQMELNCFLRKTWTRELHFDVVISSQGYLFPVLFFPFSLLPHLWNLVYKSQRSYQTSVVVAGLVCIWF